jgi:hypothetical protein
LILSFSLTSICGQRIHPKKDLFFLIFSVFWCLGTFEKERNLFCTKICSTLFKWNHQKVWLKQVSFVLSSVKMWTAIMIFVWPSHRKKFSDFCIENFLFQKYFRSVDFSFPWKWQNLELTQKKLWNKKNQKKSENKDFFFLIVHSTPRHDKSSLSKFKKWFKIISRKTKWFFKVFEMFSVHVLMVFQFNLKILSKKFHFLVSFFLHKH